MGNLIIGHLVGDFLLQNDWMAQGKKRSSLICGVHCLVYTATIAVFGGWLTWWVLGIVFASHFAQDRTGIVRWWMHKAGQRAFAEPPMAPWSLIVVDNTLHLLVLWILSKGAP